MIDTITKRDGQTVPYSRGKIAAAIGKAMGADPGGKAANLAEKAEEKLIDRYADGTPSVEGIQDIVEEVLMENGYPRVAKKYILYREERSRQRLRNTDGMAAIREALEAESKGSDLKTSNANVDGNAPMGIMLQVGAEASKEYYMNFVLTPEQREAHREGKIHIHDLDFYSKTTTCCQLDLEKLFKGGFSTGHGYLREPSSIGSAASLAAIAIQANQNDQHGGQSVPMLDYYLAPYVAKTFAKAYFENIRRAMELNGADISDADAVFGAAQDAGLMPAMDESAIDGVKRFLAERLGIPFGHLNWAYERSFLETEKQTHQAMEGFVHNLNTLHSRAGKMIAA
jgi:ribonucleoside-triphosphate reductase